MITVSPKHNLLDDKRADVRAQIAALYERYALEIADSLGDNPLCVVAGPRRFGKTTSLLPALAGILRGRGNETRIMNGRDYEGEAFSAGTLPSRQFDVVIIDEANVLTRTEKETADVLRLLHTKGNAIVSAITFHAGYQSAAMFLGTAWLNAECSISGYLGTVVYLPQMVVTPKLAQDLLTIYSPIKNEVVRLKVLTYIIERVPLNPHVLLELSGARSIIEANRIVHQRRGTRFQGALSPDEYRTLEQSLEE